MSPTALCLFSVSLVGIAASGCSSSPATIELNFPSERPFLFSQFATIKAFSIAADEQDECPRLQNEVLSGTASNAVGTPSSPVCAFENGGMTLTDLPRGLLAYVAVVRNESNQPLLSGCTIADVYEGDDTVVIHLFLTDQYRRLYADPSVTPQCSSVAAKCGGGC